MNPAPLHKGGDPSQQPPGVQPLVLNQPVQAPFLPSVCNKAVWILILLKLLVAV